MTQVIVTCEHAGNAVPAPFSIRFRGLEERLSGHEGWDPGARELAEEFGMATGGPPHLCTLTRLLIDTNRSFNNPDLFSNLITRTAHEQAQLISNVWHPHRSAVKRAVAAALNKGGDVVMLSVHSFTPVWRGRPREVDVGFLFDPSRTRESGLCQRWTHALGRMDPSLRVRDNEPYGFAHDGLDKTLRQRHGGDRLAVICLEVSQGLALGPPDRWAEVRRSVISAFVESCPSP